MAKILKVGIVGCGGVVKHRHLPAYNKMKRKVTVPAICDMNESLAKETASTYHIPGAHASLTQMLAAEKLDIVDICTPPQTHAPLAVEALEHGCHVLIEKPMALKASECDRMIEAARKNGRKICVDHNVLFHPPFLKAKELLAKGSIGTFTGMRIFMSDHRDKFALREDFWVHKLPGGLLGESGPHAAYMSLAMLNKINGVDIVARSFLEHPWAQFDEFRIELDGENGTSSIFISDTSNRHHCQVDIYGTEGALHLDLNSMLLHYQGRRDSLKPVDLARYSLGTAWRTVAGVAGNALKVVTGSTRLGLEVIIDRFIDSIVQDSQPPVTGEEGRDTVRIMEMIVSKLHEKYGTAK